MLPLLALVLVWPVVELVVAIAISRQIGPGATLLALVLVSVLGGAVFKRTGLSVWRRANAELAAGRSPTRQLLDGALVVVGGVGLLVPGFVSGALGALVLLPPVRALLRPLLLGWMGRRATRAARSGRFGGIVVDTVVGADGTVRRRSHRVGEVIDSEGWEAGDEPRQLRPGPGAPDDQP
jgi:UPF0716 protein FxsA